MMRFLRSAFVIGRRDFGATVLSKTFIFFLLGPLFPLLLGGVFGGIGARVASHVQRPVVAVIGPSRQFQSISAARDGLAQATGDDEVIRFVHYDAERNVAAQRSRLLASGSPPVQAVLTGGAGQFRLVGDVHDGDPSYRQLDLILRNAESAQGGAPRIRLEPTRTVSPGSLGKDRSLTAQIAQVALFFLTLMLSTMVLSQLIEEKSNKIIEVIAAAMPIDAMFVGKLFAMLCASVLALLVWVGAGALLIQTIKAGGVATLSPPALGWPTFLALGVVYFGMNYLLLGAAFLTIGAQASTAREVQTMSMPVTFGQVLIFGFASSVVGAPDSPLAMAAAIFPLSSPMAMLARAAQDSTWWPHLLAIGWQALWVALILRLGAKLFRKTVLKSGPRTRWWRRRPA